MRHICYFCHLRSVGELIEKFNPSEEISDLLIQKVHNSLTQNWDAPNPQIAAGFHRIVKEVLGINDLYASEKESANKVLLKDYDYWKLFVNNSENPFQTAARLAVVGNIIDYGAHSLKGELITQIKELLKTSLYLDETESLRKAVAQAKSILYLGDNAGEAVFDKLFIEKIYDSVKGNKNYPKVTFVCRGTPVINDMTLEDAKRVGIDKVCEIIDNGSDAPSTVLPECSLEFQKRYKEADLIISKGQGNLEGLVFEHHPNTYFMLIAKCKPMAEILSIPTMKMVVTKRQF
ncbi:MAG: ARMT1-like domain-containing protein [Bacteroidales bacterium]